MIICVFGDSITWGAFLPSRVSWANLLRNHLEKKSDKIALYDLGIDANTSTDLLRRFKIEAKARNPNVIIIAIGINDSAYRKDPGNPLTREEDFKNNIKELIKLSRSFTNRVFLVGLVKGSDKKTCPLPRSTTEKCYTKSNTKKYNDIIKKTCSNSRVIFINLFEKLGNTDFHDGLHPNSSGHQIIFNEVTAVLEKENIIKSTSD